MKKIIILSIIFTVLNIFFININVTYATDNWTKHQIPWWQPSKLNKEVGQEEIINKANVITTAIRNIGMVVAVLALMVIGFRSMVASADEKSIIKESLPGYIVGVVMIVAVTVLPSIIYKILK